MIAADDSVLIERVLAGDREAYGGIVHRYQDRLFRVAWLLTGNHADARDVTQDALLRAYSKLGTFDRSRRFYTWAYRILTNLAIDRLRSRGKLRPSALPSDVPDPGEGPEGRALGEELRREVREALDELPPRYRTLLVLRDAQGLSGKAISEASGVGHATIRWRIHRARKLFRAAWDRRTGRREGRGR